MTENNVMEFCQWLVSEKGIEAGNLSDYINNNEEEVLKLAQEFKKPKFKVGGKVEAAAEKFKCGGKAEEKQDGGKMSRKEYKANKTSRKDLKNAANDRGYSDDQFSKSYYSLKDSFRNNGLSRRDAKLAAQRVIMGNTPAEVEDVAPTEPIYSYSRPSAPTYSWEPGKFYDGFDDMQFEITPVRRKTVAQPTSVSRTPMVFSDMTAPTMKNTNAMASFINPLNNKIYLRNNSVPSDIIDGGVMEGIVVTAPGIVDGGMIDEVTVTAPGKPAKKSGFRTRTMPGRFGLAHYQGGGQVYKNLRLPKENLELIVNKGDSIVMRTPNPANGSYTYIKRKGEQNWSGNMQNSMGDFEEFKKEQANAEARRIIDILKKTTKFDDGGEIVKAQGGDKVYNPGEIRADDRTKLGRWWDKVKTGYRNSSFANSGVVEAMKFTPLGILDSVLTGDVGIIDLAGIIPGAKPVTNVANKVSKVNRSPVGRKLNDVLYEMYDAATNADGNMRSSGKMFKGLAEDLRKEAKDIVEKQFGTKFSDFEFDQFLTKKAEAYAKHRSKMPNNTEYRDWLDARDNYFKFAQHHYIKNRQ